MIIIQSRGHWTNILLVFWTDTSVKKLSWIIMSGLVGKIMASNSLLHDS